MLAECGLLGDLQQYSFSPDGQPLCVYGDPAYPISVHMQRLFPGLELTHIQEEYNAAMGRVRVSVEWVFGDIANYFAFVDFKKKLKIGLSAVAKMYSVCALLTNARTCLTVRQYSTSAFYLCRNFSRTD